MSGRLAGKAAIVTGGAKGIGFGIVKRFVEEGANVLLADLDEKAAQESARKLSGPGRVVTMQSDVSEDKAGGRMVARAVEAFGGLDVLVNNAGIFPQVPMMQMGTELFDKVLKVNLMGLAYASKAAAARMIEQGRGGKIINIASIDAFHPSMVGLAAYDASKGGVLMFTRSLALELGPQRITVNGIAPGGIITEGTSQPLSAAISEEQMKKIMEGFTARIPLGRMGVPDDIAKVAVFLASSDSDYMTGETIVVDGGVLLA